MRNGSSFVGHPVDVATGIVHANHRDIFIAGRLALTWDRRHSAALLHTAPSALGPGWTAPYFATLTRDADGFVFVTPEGDAAVFPDPLDSIDAGGVVRNLSSFQELARVGDRYSVTRWSWDNKVVMRYLFVAGRRGQVWPMASVENASGHGLDLFYDDLGRLQRVRQRLEQRALLLEYGQARSRIVSVSLLTPDGRRRPLVGFEYDAEGRLAASVDALGSADRFEYDAHSRLSREVYKDGSVFRFRYDDAGRCTWTSGQDRYDQKALRYYDAIRWTEVTNSIGDVTRYEWTAAGQVTRVVYPDGAVTRTDYDEYARVIAEVDGTGGRTQYEYDGQGDRFKTIDPLGNTYALTFNSSHLPLTVTLPTGAVWKREYDSQNRVVATTDPLGARWNTTYDAVGNPLQIVSPTGRKKRQAFSATGVLREATDWGGNWTRYRFDDFGRIVERIDPEGDTVRVQFDPLGNALALEYSERIRIAFSYDSAGNITRVVDANGDTTHYRYGPGRRMLERSDPLGGTVRLKWGTEPGRLEQVVNEIGESYTYEYDQIGRVVRESGFDGRETTYQYDLAGRPIAITNGNGETVALKRDASGRMVKQILPDGSTVNYGYDAINNLVAAVNADCTLTFERDALGQVIREQQGDCSLETQFDLLGEVTSTVTSLGHEATYEHDGNGLLVGLTVGGKHAIAFSRDTAGKETRRVFDNRLWVDQEWDEVGNLAQQKVRVSLTGGPTASGSTMSPILTRRFVFNGRRELLSVEDDRWGHTAYTYDASRRLRVAQRDKAGSERYAYDDAGNLTAVRTERAPGRPDVDETFTYEPGHRLSKKGDASYFYDLHGRLVRKVEGPDSAEPREWEYRWDALDRLRSVRTPAGDEWRYAYDALGRRVGKQGPDTRIRYVWDGDTLLHEIREDTRPHTWVFGPGSYAPLAKLQGDEFYPIVTDPVGTPREALSTWGELVWSAGPPTWSGPFEPRGSVDCAIRFPGQWHDAESGLFYNRFRYYDPASARYVSPDPIGLSGGLHPYQYGLNPINWIDPWGWDFFRGARGDQPPSFAPRPGEYKVRDGQVQPTHGVSVFNNPESVSNKGFTPHQIDPASVPASLQIIQRGTDPAHFEIVPRAPMTEAEYKAALAEIRTTPPSPPGGPSADDEKPKQEGCD